MHGRDNPLINILWPKTPLRSRYVCRYEERAVVARGSASTSSCKVSPNYHRLPPPPTAAAAPRPRPRRNEGRGQGMDNNYYDSTITRDIYPSLWFNSSLSYRSERRAAITKGPSPDMFKFTSGQPSRRAHPRTCSNLRL